MVGHHLQGFSTTRKVLEKQAPISQAVPVLKTTKFSLLCSLPACQKHLLHACCPRSPCPALSRPTRPLPLLQVLGLVARFGATIFRGCLFSSLSGWALGDG